MGAIETYESKLQWCITDFAVLFCIIQEMPKRELTSRFPKWRGIGSNIANPWVDKMNQTSKKGLITLAYLRLVAWKRHNMIPIPCHGFILSRVWHIFAQSCRVFQKQGKPGNFVLRHADHRQIIRFRRPIPVKNSPTNSLSNDTIFVDRRKVYMCRRWTWNFTNLPLSELKFQKLMSRQPKSNGRNGISSLSRQESMCWSPA